MKRENSSLQVDSPKVAAAKTAGVATDRKAAPWKKLVPSRTQLRDLKLEALYHEASLAFHSRGYAGTSLAEIAAALGISKAALYYYVDSKQQLLLDCHMAASDAADAVIAQVPKTGLNGLEKLHLALRLHVESILSESSTSVLALEESALTPENFRAVVQRRDRFQSAVLGFIIEGIGDGSVIDCDPKIAAFALLGGANWVEKWYRPGGPWSAAQTARGIADILVRGVAADTAIQPRHRVTDYTDDALPAQSPPRVLAAAKKSRRPVRSAVEKK